MAPTETKLVKVAVDGAERFVEVPIAATEADLVPRIAEACRKAHGPGALTYRDDCYHYKTVASSAVLHPGRP